MRPSGTVTGSTEGLGRRFHGKFCKIADRLIGCALHILKKNCETRPRPLASARFAEKGGGTARLVVLALGAKE